MSISVKYGFPRHGDVLHQRQQGSHPATPCSLASPQAHWLPAFISLMFAVGFQIFPGLHLPLPVTHSLVPLSLSLYRLNKMMDTSQFSLSHFYYTDPSERKHNHLLVKQVLPFGTIFESSHLCPQLDAFSTWCGFNKVLLRHLQALPSCPDLSRSSHTSCWATVVTLPA